MTHYHLYYYVAVEIPLLPIDPTWTKPKLRPVAATDIHKFAKYDVKKINDKQKLMVRACEALETNIEKLKRKKMQKQSADQSDMINESSDQDYDTTNNSANSCEVFAVAPELSSQQTALREASLQNYDTTNNSTNSCEVFAVAPKSSSQQTAIREAALEHYKKQWSHDVNEMEMDHFLKDTEELITGKPQYRLLKSKGNSKVGLLQIAKVDRPPKPLKESDRAYHQIQALLYAGDSKYSYCHHVQFNQRKKFFLCTEVVPSESWKKKVVGNVRKYFEYYNAIWAKAQQQFQDSKY